MQVNRRVQHWRLEISISCKAPYTWADEALLETTVPTLTRLDEEIAEFAIKAFHQALEHLPASLECTLHFDPPFERVPNDQKSNVLVGEKHEERIKNVRGGGKDGD